MTTKDFAQSIVDEISRLQPISYLQVQTLGDFVHWFIDPKAKISQDVLRGHLDHLVKLTKDFLATQLELSAEAEDEQETTNSRVPKVVDLLLDLRIELLLARSRHYLKILWPIHNFTANPNVVWDVYMANVDGQELAISHAKGAEIWAKRALMSLELSLKRNNVVLSSEQKEAAWQRILADASRTKSSFITPT